MFCITIAENTYSNLFQKLEKASLYTNLFEIRADYLEDLKSSEFEKLFTYPYRFIFTFRSYEEGGYKKISDQVRLEWILWALTKNFYLVDIEWKFFKKFYESFKNSEREKILVSYHNFRSTPQDKYLKRLINEMKERGIKNAKIVCMSKDLGDSLRLLNLIFLAKKQGINLISFGMGKKGRLSRIFSVFCGSPFTYVVLSKEEAVAPGQLDIDSAQEIYKNFQKLV